MKRFFKTAALLFALSAMIGLTGCGSKSDLLDKVPADADIAGFVNLQAIVESGGGKLDGNKLTLPKYFTDAMKALDSYRHVDDMVEQMKEYGLDFEELGFCINFSQEYNYVVMKIADEKKLLAYFEDNDYREREGDDGVTFYEFEYNRDWSNSRIFSENFVAIDGKYAFFVDDDAWDERKPSRLFEKIKDALDEQTMASTKWGSFAADGNAGGMVISLNRIGREAAREVPAARSVAKGYIAFKGEIETEEAEIACAWFDEDGNRRSADDFGVSFNAKAKVSDDALQYIPASECFVATTALENVNWDKLADAYSELADPYGRNRMAISMVTTYLSKIDGTVAFGIGFDGSLYDLADFDYRSFDKIPMTLVVQTKEGKARGIMGDIKAGLTEWGIDFTSNANGFTASLPQGMGSIYGLADGNIVVLSTRKIAKANNKIADMADMDDYISSMALYLPAKYPLMDDLGVKDDLLLYLNSDASDSEATLTLKLTGNSQGKIVERATRYILSIAENADAISRKMRERRYGSYYDDYYYDDDVAVVQEIAEFDYADSAYVEAVEAVDYADEW